MDLDYLQRSFAAAMDELAMAHRRDWNASRHGYRWPYRTEVEYEADIAAASAECTEAAKRLDAALELS